MRKAVAILLFACSILLHTACAQSDAAEHSGNADQSMEALFWTVRPADEALELAKRSDAVVMERQGCTSGKEVWDAFFRTVSGGSPASVLCAQDYVLDPEHMSEELYEQEKAQYSKLFFYLVEYDGAEYAVKIRGSTEEALDAQERFQYLLHFTGSAAVTALYSDDDNYVLVDDPSATWEGIMAGMVSSQLGAGYKHCTVYRDCPGWK